MNRFITLSLFTLFFLSFFSISSCGGSNHQTEKNTTESARELDFVAEVSFLRGEQDTLSTVDVAIADDNESRSQGLMNVPELPVDTGMLFIFPNDRTRSFWMANTPLSLDIIFVNSDMEIVRIHRNTQPFSQESIRSEVPAKFVVEVTAGYTLEYDIREGMKIRIEGADLE